MRHMYGPPALPQDLRHVIELRSEVIGAGEMGRGHDEVSRRKGAPGVGVNEAGGAVAGRRRSRNRRGQSETV